LEFRRLSAEGAREARDTVELVYEDAYAAAIASGDPFESLDASMERFDSYAANPLLDLVIAYQDGEPAGQTWGWPLGQGSRWWEGLTADPEPGFTDEDGTRTFGLSEIMVRRRWTGRGIAHALHDELLAGRHEKRASLLVDPQNDAAYRAYLRWGWRKVSQLRPHFENAPLFDVLMLSLPLREPSS
jgi:ribosomal protein S18 acetylase RimI-like enzyme